LADVLTLAALGLSAVTFVAILYVLIVIKRGTSGNGPDTNSLESTLGEVKGTVTSLHTVVTQLLPTISDIKSTADQTSTDMGKMRDLANLVSGSSQKRGAFGEIVIQQYLEQFPRSMWDPQYGIPGAEGRVDYVLRIRNNKEELLLPIDSKFSLPENSESFVRDANEKALDRAAEVVKYMVPGVTTDFAVMVVPHDVLLALTSETLMALQEIKVIPCSPQGVVIFCTLAIRAQQAVVIARNVESLRSYLQEIDIKLDTITEEMKTMVRSLNGASKHAKNTVKELVSARSKLADKSVHLEGVTAPEIADASRLVAPPSLADGDEDDATEGA
jgi:DNA anti-recombination protein RmuC